MLTPLRTAAPEPRATNIEHLRADETTKPVGKELKSVVLKHREVLSVDEAAMELQRLAPRSGTA